MPPVEENINLSIYSNGKTIEELCPDRLRPDWEKTTQLMDACLVSLREAKVSFEENNVFSLIPQRITEEYKKLRRQVVEHVVATNDKPRNYDLLESIAGLVEKIGKQKLNIDLSCMKDHMHSYVGRRFYKTVKNAQPYIKYNIFGTKTGRLSTQQGSFPILTISKNYRSVLRPTNGYFVELDFNATELRVLLALSEIEQPQEDLHDWNIQNVFRGVGTREEAKKRMFAWLYNPASKDYLLDRFYSRESVVKKYFNNGQVTTFFDRTIESDEYHALNYIIQSTASDLFMKQVLKIDKLLEGKKSFISFMVHDSFVIDFHKEDKGLLKEVIRIFSDTEFGKFKTNLKIGTDFGNIRRVDYG